VCYICQEEQDVIVLHWKAQSAETSLGESHRGEGTDIDGKFVNSKQHYMEKLYRANPQSLTS